MSVNVADKNATALGTDIQGASGPPADTSAKEQDSPNVLIEQTKSKQDPLTWPTTKKWRILVVVSFMAFLTSAYPSKVLTMHSHG
jgi:hypothetical protein